MFKRIITRFINGFCYSIAITTVIQGIQMISIKDTPMLPEFAARFESQVTAFVVQLILIGIMSGITSAGTVVFELKRIGLLVQSLLFLFIILGSWIPVACIAWGFYKYVISMVITTISIIVTYSICWIIMYRICRRDINEINVMLCEEKE